MAKLLIFLEPKLWVLFNHEDFGIWITDWKRKVQFVSPNYPNYYDCVITTVINMHHSLSIALSRHSTVLWDGHWSSLTIKETEAQSCSVAWGHTSGKWRIQDLTALPYLIFGGWLLLWLFTVYIISYLLTVSNPWSRELFKNYPFSYIFMALTESRSMWLIRAGNSCRLAFWPSPIS